MFTYGSKCRYCLYFISRSAKSIKFNFALIGGFSIALIAGLITLEKTRLNKVIMIVMSFVTVSQIGTTLFLALSSFRIYTYTANKNLDKLTMLMKNFDQTLTPFILVFFISVIAFFGGVSLTSWNYGKKVGIVVSILSALMFFLVLFGLSILRF